MSLTPAIDALADEAWEAEHPVTPHYHTDSRGFVHTCYHKCMSWFGVRPMLGFVAATIITFPLEHALYEKVYPFTVISHWLGV